MGGQLLGKLDRHRHHHTDAITRPIGGVDRRQQGAILDIVDPDRQPCAGRIGKARTQPALKPRQMSR